MKCPKCGCVRTEVDESRPYPSLDAVRRARRCKRCGYRFPTLELPATTEFAGRFVIRAGRIELRQALRRRY